MSRSRAPLLFTLVATFAIASASPMWAQAAKFKSTSGSCSGTNLQISFREIGVGSTASVGGSCTASAVYECINGGGKHPQATNKETVTAPSNAGPTTFISHNGTVTGTLTFTPPGSGNFSCPGGQQLVLSSVTYSSCSLQDTTNDSSTNVSGTFTCP
jgi:hypothetical protein